MVSALNDLFPPCTAPACIVDESEKQLCIGKAPCEMAEKCVSACSAYGRVCPCAARIAGHAACDATAELKKNSRVFTTEKPDFTYLNADDLVIGKKLGEGGFSNVNQCVITYGEEAGQEFAVKYLKRKAMVDLHTFKHGAADLAIEAYFLQTLSHPNIVKLHGVTAGSVETNVASGKEWGFFIVVDRLFDTLEALLDNWRIEKENTTENFLTRLSDSHKKEKKRELMERMRIALSIAEAIDYLHEHNIVFRDLKPDNIGFDKDGVLKIFDFGLAKELKPEDVHKDGRYCLTGNTGSRRYMAPEVAKECPYNDTVDVFSFGILLWELCSAEKPFFGYSSGKHMQQVVLGGERPKMDSQHTSNWPMNLQWLMKRCWSSFPALRPSFAVIKMTLKDILMDKDTIPDVLRIQTGEEQEEEEENPVIEPPSGGFSGLFRPQKSRSKSSGKSDVQAIKKPSKRGKSWGFALGR
jgi:serine/threonine protein kinase